MNALRRWVRRARHGSPIVVVSGLPRSGTSMAMKMLEAGGLDVMQDGLRTADEDNPKGYFEHERVKDLARETDKSWLREARGRCIKVISYLLKDLPSSNNYRVIFMHRDLEEVLASQAKMLDHREEGDETDDERMIDLYQNHLWRVDYLFKHSPHLEPLELAYRDLVADPLTGAQRICEFLGGTLDVQKMVAVVEPELYRNRARPAGRGDRQP